MADSWEQLKRDCEQCSMCTLREKRNRVVFGIGDEHSELMLIGEAPGGMEDIHGVPFVGTAGQLLDDMLEMIDLDRRKLYIANMVKCRPPRNRDPSSEEQAQCNSFLRRQIALVDPKIIVCLGRIAAMGIIKDNFKITQEHGLWFDVDGRRCMATFHPSALLRDVSKRPDAFSDLRELRKELRARCPGIYGL